MVNLPCEDNLAHEDNLSCKDNLLSFHSKLVIHLITICFRMTFVSFIRMNDCLCVIVSMCAQMSKQLNTIPDVYHAYMSVHFFDESTLPSSLPGFFISKKELKMLPVCHSKTCCDNGSKCYIVLLYSNASMDEVVEWFHTVFKHSAIGAGASVFVRSTGK